MTGGPVPGDDPVDRPLALMGTHVRILIGPRTDPDAPPPREAADRVEAFLRGYNAALSRFIPESELSRLNADPREVVPASPLLRSAVRAALEAAEVSGGLVDPALLDGLEAAGYRESWDAAKRLDLRAALAETTAPRRPARPDPAARWRLISVDDEAGTISRPPGLRIDTGGTGKGHAADSGGALLDGYADWAVDCGGDLRMGGTSGARRSVEVEHPFTGEMLPGFAAAQGAVATSGVRGRIWRGTAGEVAHHLIDPSTGTPAFTGLVAVTALAPTAVLAEALAKTALLRGPDGAGDVLAPYGGIAFDEAGAARRFGSLASAQRVRFTVRETHAA